MSYRMKKLKCFHAGAPGRERSSDVSGGTFDVLEATFERKGVAAFKTSTSHVCTFKRQTWSPNVRLTCKRARFRAQKGGMRRVSALLVWVESKMPTNQPVSPINELTPYKLNHLYVEPGVDFTPFLSRKHFIRDVYGYKFPSIVSVSSINVGTVVLYGDLEIEFIGRGWWHFLELRGQSAVWNVSQNVDAVLF
jgi:hypothetical protein